MAASDESLQTIAARAPVTAKRRVNPILDEQMPKPYLARALVAVDPECINGSKGHNHNNMSVLQQHVAFFDRDNDGIVYPWETYKGFRAVGFNILISFLAPVIIHLALSYATLPGWIPSLLFPIYIDNIHRAKHGSDTEVYDTEGRFDPAKFDAIFGKYALTDPHKITFSELCTMTNANRNANDFLGWFAAAMEWGLLYLLAKDKDGCVEKEAIRGLFDGSLFEYHEAHNASCKGQ
eukprot:Gb_39637 [translate_table: standard]